MDALHRIQDGIGQALVQMNVVGAEAEHERSAGLSVGPDPGRCCERCSGCAMTL